MTLASAWSILETPVVLIGTAVVLAIAALAMLTEYRRLFMQDPKSVMSAEVLMAVISRSGGPGYLAAFLLAGAILFLVLGMYYFLTTLHLWSVI